LYTDKEEGNDRFTKSYNVIRETAPQKKKGGLLRGRKVTLRGGKSAKKKATQPRVLARKKECRTWKRSSESEIPM